MDTEIIFLDTEFTGLHSSSTLISLGMVCQSGKTFYAEFTDYDTTQISPWLKENVINKLQGNLPVAATGVITGNEVAVCGSRETIATVLRQWLAQFGVIEIWADVPAYDWILFCQLFGGAMHIPKNIFYAPFDIATLFRIKNLIEPVGKYERDISRHEFAGIDTGNQHHALNDALVVKACYKKLMML